MLALCYSHVCNDPILQNHARTCQLKASIHLTNKSQQKMDKEKKPTHLNAARKMVMTGLEALSHHLQGKNE
jgi:hypothetical protein